MRAAALVVGLAVGGLGLASCAGAGSGPSLTLYNGQHVQTTDALVAGFEKATGVRVQVRSADEDTLADQIVTEGGRSRADVIYTENSPALELLQDKALLASVEPPTLSRVPGRYNSPQGDWVGVSARVSVLVYDPAILSASQLPASILGLAAPRYRGRLALAPAETDFQPVVTSVLRAYGRSATLRWLRGIKANAGSHIYPDNETVTAEVNRGNAALGVINQYYWYRLRAQLGASHVTSRIAYFAPRNPGYVLDISGAAVLRSSRHQAAAQRFLAYLVSPAAQEIIARSDSFEYPIVPGVAAARAETPLAQLAPDPVTVAQLGDGSTAIALLQEVGLL